MYTYPLSTSQLQVLEAINLSYVCLSCLICKMGITIREPSTLGGRICTKQFLSPMPRCPVEGALVTVTAQAHGTMVAVLQLGPNAPSHISHRLGSVAELITFW